MSDSQYRVENPTSMDRMPISIPHPAIDEPPAPLHVPDAPHRPGDEPRFSRFKQQPGELQRPDPLDRYDLLRSHATGLVRVLGDDGAASGSWDPKLPPAALRSALELMVLTRQYDMRMMTMQRQGRLSFYLESRGEEAVAIAGGMPLAPGDLAIPAYRQQGLFLQRGMPLVQMMSQCIGNQQDNCKGRQMPVHYSWKENGLYSISSPVGTQFSQAVGAAMASAYRGERQVTSTWIGDGTAAQGDFHYGLNFASVYMPPVILNVVNNQWAISTHRNMATGGKTFAARAEAYGVPGIRVDGNDFLAVFAVTRWAVERARNGGGPTLIELLTYRVGGHSSSDDPTTYRPADEARLWPGGDPIQRLADHLIQAGEWSADRQRDIESRLEKRVAATFKEAEGAGSLADGPFAPGETLVDDVYATIPFHLKRQQEQLRKKCG